MLTANFDFHLPEELIAQSPPPSRDASRLLVFDRATGNSSHFCNFSSILGFLRSGDLLVLNNSKVIPARLRGHKTSTSGEVELLLLEEVRPNCWWTLLRPGKRVRSGTRITLLCPSRSETVQVLVLEKNESGQYLVEFQLPGNRLLEVLDQFGEMPLPPYIVRPPELSDRDRYQTIFAQHPGSVAAPTAGLHVTEELFTDLRSKGVEIQFVTLHVGAGTFAPVKAEQVENHVMHEERFEITPDTANTINRAISEGRRVIAVGTTTLRVLESVAQENAGKVISGPGRTRIFIYPPFQFRIVSALVTNFHLPRSSLLMLVSAFLSPGRVNGKDLILNLYQEAIQKRYRFFSYGDAMFIYS